MSLLLELSDITHFVRPSLVVEEYQQEGDPAFYLAAEKHWWTAAGFRTNRPPDEVAGVFEKLVLTHQEETWAFENAQVQLARAPFNTPTDKYQYVITFDKVVRE
jgi:hypothetical protein